MAVVVKMIDLVCQHSLLYSVLFILPYNWLSQKKKVSTGLMLLNIIPKLCILYTNSYAMHS